MEGQNVSTVLQNAWLLVMHGVKIAVVGFFFCFFCTVLPVLFAEQMILIARACWPFLLLDVLMNHFIFYILFLYEKERNMRSMWRKGWLGKCQDCLFCKVNKVSCHFKALLFSTKPASSYWVLKRVSFSLQRLMICLEAFHIPDGLQQ